MRDRPLKEQVGKLFNMSTSFLHKAPTPDGQSIDFTRVPARRLATLQFSWWTTTERVETKTKVLFETLEANGIETVGRPFLMRYNDPWTPPFVRRNEVPFEVR